MLENKNAIIYGAGGSIGGGVARAFAREGAKVFLTGRNRDNLDAVANDVAAAGGRAEVAVVDALDERAVDEHAKSVADAAIDTYIRNLAAEIGPHGVRVLGLWVAGVPESFTPEKLAAVNSDMQMDEAAIQGLLAQLAGMRMLRRSPTLAEVADTAAFLASDKAIAITGAFVNVTGGIFNS